MTSNAEITWISGPVLRARTSDEFHINEAAFVGVNKLLGEVIRLEQREIIVQVFEDTTGLRPGDKVTANGLPLSVKLGPAILGGIFDGLLRPLTGKTSEYIQPGMRQSEPKTFSFVPAASLGANIQGGAIFGSVKSPMSLPQHCLVPPHIQGKLVWIAAAGDYLDNEKIATVKADDSTEYALTMSQIWPVREPRPIQERLSTWGPLLTGQRIFDSLFPLACGGRAALPGGFGTGKTVLQETLAKWCDADVIVYVGCGERGNEMAGVLNELPALEDPRTGRALMERTVIIANTSNMPVAAREASIYTGVTVAEYLRDQGLRVALMADSTSRWAEALREVSGRLGELPSEGGYPAYLSSRLADFYERAAHVRTLSGRIGSLSIIGAVSPPSADFSEPVTTHTRRYVRVFWALDPNRAQARFYPAVHPLQSYSGDIAELADYWKQQDHPDWLQQRKRFLTLLEQQSRLERMARIVGKDALPARQQHILLAADLINEAFLRQSAFSPVDRYCSPVRQSTMMKLINSFIDLSEQAMNRGIEIAKIQSMPVIRKLRRMNEDIEEEQLTQFDVLRSEMESAFASLRHTSTEHVS